ncbi:MAG: flagellar basal body-associated FliL family protein [Oleiphilaceae bacterium]|nr:flagellar basal body-associated FliL family protein [Oleiphilaceae bacterium]
MNRVWKMMAVVMLAWHVITTVHAEEEPAAPQIQYYDLDPPFVTNYDVSTNKLKFVKATVAVRATSQAAITEFMSHEPMIRHEIVMLLSRQTEETMSSSAGQEAIRTEALKLVQDALKQETGSTQIDDLLFTEFVVQR